MFIICGIGSVHYHQRRNDWFSELFVFVSFVFWGIILIVTNLLISIRLKNKQILNSFWIYQVSYLIAYFLLCVASELLDKPAYSYDLAFLMPFILFAISIFLNVIIIIIKKTINHDGIFDKVSLIACILLLCFSVVSITHYYIKCNPSKEWAQMVEGIVIWDDVRKVEENTFRYYGINAVKSLI